MQNLILYILKISWRNGCGSIPRRGKENELGYWVFEDFWMIISCHHKHCVFLFLFLHRFSNWINYWWNGICIRSSLLHWTSCTRLKARYRHKVAWCALATNNLSKNSLIQIKFYFYNIWMVKVPWRFFIRMNLGSPTPFAPQHSKLM